MQLAQLRELGECINYNAYGDNVEDLHYHPADLYQTLSRYPDPFQFITGEPVLEILRAARADDLVPRGRNRTRAGNGALRDLRVARRRVEPARERHLRQSARARQAPRARMPC